MHISIKEKFMFLGNSITGKYPPLRFLLRFIAFQFWTLNLKSRTHGKGLDPNRIYWVNPETIRHFSLKEFDPRYDRGLVIGGNWDRLDKEFEDLDVYRAIREHFIDGKNWEDTDFYNRVLNEIVDGNAKWGCRTKAEWDKRLKLIELLYQDIKNAGYKPRNTLSQEGLDYPVVWQDEISVNIGRGGDLLFNDGKHRLSICKILKVPKIPIRIVARHSKWVDFRRRLFAFAEEQGGKLYHPVIHPDLRDIESYYDEDRFELIKRNLSVQKGTVLDIGAALGYFCHRFEEEGFDCYAVESSSTCSYFLQKLKRAQNRAFKIIPHSIFEYKRGETLTFDIVLAINIFHHFLKKKDTYTELIALLKRLKTKELFFQAHNPDEAQMVNAYKNYQPNEFCNFILKHSCLTRSKLVGTTKDERRIYKIYN